jgi:hypothetical protein
MCGSALFTCDLKRVAPEDLAKRIAQIAEGNEFVFEKPEQLYRNWQCGRGNDFFLHVMGGGQYRVDARYWTDDEIGAVRDVLVRSLGVHDRQPVPASAEDIGSGLAR